MALSSSPRPNPVRAPFGGESSRLPFDGVCDMHGDKITTVRTFVVVANGEALTLCKPCTQSLCHK